MKHKVELYVAGRVFNEQVYAKNYDEARQVALARNPNARIISDSCSINKTNSIVS